MKKLAIFLLVSLMLFSLAACGSAPEETTAEGTKTHASESETAEMTTKETDETTLGETYLTENLTSVGETETESGSDTESETVSGSDTESDTDSSSSESVTDEAPENETEQKVVAFPEEDATVTLANAEVYGWWKKYKFGKTDSDPFYRHEDIYYPVPVIFTWEKDESADYYRFYISTDEGFLSCESYLVNNNSISLDHLFVGTDYYWTVISTKVVDGEEVNSKVVPTRSFTTAKSPRCLRIEGVSNTRDIGGLENRDGYRIKQGMIYRGGKLEGITEEGKAYFLDVIGVKTDLDLRTPGEGGAGSGSPLGEDVNYVNIDGRYYVGSKGINTEEGKKLFAQEIRLFADPDNYPIYIHCSLGRDRTGTLAFVIEALLGVSRNDAYMDYELSVFSVTGTQDNAGVAAIRNNIESTCNYIMNYYEGSNLAEKTENYLLSIGITEDEIQTIRDLLLEEVK